MGPLGWQHLQVNQSSVVVIVSAVDTSGRRARRWCSCSAVKSEVGDLVRAERLNHFRSYIGYWRESSNHVRPYLSNQDALGVRLILGESSELGRLRRLGSRGVRMLGEAPCRCRLCPSLGHVDVTLLAVGERRYEAFGLHISVQLLRQSGLQNSTSFCSLCSKLRY